MANFKKYKGSNAYIELDHDNRSNTETKERIDHSRTYLNYNLCNIENAKEYLKGWVKKAKESGATIRDDSNLICSLILTLPENFPNNEELKRQFFKAAVELIAEDFGKDRIVSAWVHCDECKKSKTRLNKEHIHIKFAPVREKIKKYKNGTEKTIFSFDAKNCVDLKYLKAFHKRLEAYIEDYIGFKADVLTGITKAQGGNKEIEELYAISEQQEKNRDIINKEPKLILAEQKKLLDEKWKQYQNETRSFWNELNPIRQRINQSIWEYRKGDKTAQKQILRDLDFIDNMFNKGVLFALISLLEGILLYTRQKIYQKHINDLKAVYEDLESIRRKFSNQQHNTKEELKSADIESIENTLNKLAKTGTTAHELIKEVLWRMPELSNDLVMNREYEK